MLMHRVDYPVDARVSPNGLVLRVDEDDLKELVRGVLAYPVGVQHTESSAASAGFLLRQEKGRVRWMQLHQLVHSATLCHHMSHHACALTSL